MPKKIDPKEIALKKIEAKKALIRNINRFLNNYFKWFVFIVVILILIIGYFKFIKPRYDQMKKTIDLINQQREDDYYAKKQELEKIKDLLLAYSRISPSYVEKIDLVAPPKIDELFTEINQLIMNNGLLVQAVNFSVVGDRTPGNKKEQATKEKDYFASGDIGQIRIGITVRGTDYESFKNLLHSLENNLRLIDVENLGFSPGTNATSLTMVTYYLK
ncbi:hypothetical protein GF382_00055 [Candidatus Falkowbacteria bacterium]|nr:hypothetical protein [Candidatus Falkowbacteria bacterium]